MDNHYFDENGVYSESAAANPGSIPPANALRAAPPKKAGYWPVLNAARDGWDLAEDHRGEIGWLDGGRFVVSTLGPLPAGWRVTPPPDRPDWDRLQLAKTGVYHVESCRYARADGAWTTPEELFAKKPDARPCRLCRPGRLPERREEADK